LAAAIIFKFFEPDPYNAMAKNEDPSKQPDGDQPNPMYPLAFGLLILLGILALIARGCGLI
jgi:hypothetical protein